MICWSCTTGNHNACIGPEVDCTCEKCDIYGPDESTPPIICEGCGGEINPDYGRCRMCRR